MNELTLRTLIDAVVKQAVKKVTVPKFIPGTVSDGADRFAIKVLVDGDQQPITALSLVGTLQLGARVMVLFNPPSGALILGILGGPP